MFQSNRLLADSLGLVMVNFYLLKNKKRTKIPALVKCTDSSCFICCHFLFHSLSHSEVCLFWDPGQPKSEGQGGDGTNICQILKSGSLSPSVSCWGWRRTPPSSTSARPLRERRLQVIRRPWRARRPRRCRCSTWWGGTLRRGWTPRTSCGERWTPGCTSCSPCSTDGSSSRDLAGGATDSQSGRRKACSVVTWQVKHVCLIKPVLYPAEHVCIQ